MTLRSRITLVVAVLIFLMTLSILLFVNERVRSSLEASHLQWSKTIVHILAEATLNNVLEKKSHQVRETLRRAVHFDHRIAYIILTDFQGEVFAHTFDEPLPDSLALNENEVAAKFRIVAKDINFRGMSITETTYHLIKGLKAHIRIGVDRSNLISLIRTTMEGIIIVGAIILVLGLIGSFVLAQKITWPIRSLSKAMNDYATGNQTELPLFGKLDSDTKQLFNSFEEMIHQKGQVEEALKESGKRFQSLFENSEVSIWNEDFSEVRKALDKLQIEGVNDLRAYMMENKQMAWKMATMVKVKHVNEASLILFDAKAEDEIIYQIDKTFGPNSIDTFIDELCAIWDKQISFRSETIFRTLSGKEFNAIISFQIPETRNGFQSIPVSITDITELKRTEAELQQLRNYLSNIIDSMPSMLIGVNIDGNVTLWNKKAEKITGITADTAHGRNLADVFPQMAPEMKSITESMQNRKTSQEQYRTRQLDNVTHYEDVIIYPLISNGVDGAVIRIDDVTEKVRMEEMMIQSEKMLSLGGLAAGMAHEINNPLAGLMQTASVMANRLGNKLDIPSNIKAAEEAGTNINVIQNFMEARDIPRMLTTINESGHRVASIVNNMLSFARKSDSVFSSHDIAALLDKTLELASTDYDLKKQYDFKTIKIKRQYQNNLPLVRCEGVNIQQVLLNLLRNGAQAMQEAGTEMPQFIIRIHLENERQLVTIEIEDNGPGMDEAVRKRVFEPFFTTKPEGVGTGLGLSVSYFIITENNGGEMTVESQLGSGANFIVRIPVAGENV